MVLCALNFAVDLPTQSTPPRVTSSNVDWKGISSAERRSLTLEVVHSGNRRQVCSWYIKAVDCMPDSSHENVNTVKSLHSGHDGDMEDYSLINAHIESRVGPDRDKAKVDRGRA